MSTLATDDFDRGDNADLGANWTPVNDGTTGGQNHVIASNAAVPSITSDDCAEIYSGTAWPNDQWAEVTIGVSGANGVGAGSAVIVRASIGASFGYYRFVGSVDGYELTKWGGGGFVASLASGGGTTFANGDRIYLEAVGTTITAKKNTTDGAGGTQVAQVTDATLTTGSAGIGYSGINATATIASFIGGDFGSAATPVVAVNPTILRPFNMSTGRR